MIMFEWMNNDAVALSMTKRTKSHVIPTPTGSTNSTETGVARSVVTACVQTQTAQEQGHRDSQAASGRETVESHLSHVQSNFRKL